MKKSYLFLLSVLLTFGTSIYAAEFKAAEDIKIISPIQDDFYTAGGNIHIETDVLGDLIIAGGEVDIHANISEDLTVAGGKVNIKGLVQDDLRAAGGEVYISGIVKDDIVVAGGKVFIGEDAVIEGDLLMAGGDLTMKGKILGNMKMHGGNLNFTGLVNGNTDIHGGNLYYNGSTAGTSKIVSHEIVLGDDAVFQNTVEYWRENGEMDFGLSVKNGQAEYRSSLEEMSFDGFEWDHIMYMPHFLSYLAAALFIFLFVYFFPKFFKESSDILIKNPWKSFFIGILYFILTPILAIVFFATIIGIPVAAILIFSYVFSIYFAVMISAVIFASLINKHYKKKWSALGLFLASITVFILLKALLFLPVIGWAIKIVLILLAFGALIQEKLIIFKKIMK
jgi:hypothetical protein